MKLKAEKTGRWHTASHPHERAHTHRKAFGYSFSAVWKQKLSHQDSVSRERNQGNETGIGYSRDLVAVFQCAAKEASSVSMDPEIMSGQPCVAGTRIPVRSVLRAIERYGSLDAAVKCYPHLTIPQVKDALFFAQVVLEPADGVESTPIAS